MFISVFEGRRQNFWNLTKKTYLFASHRFSNAKYSKIMEVLLAIAFYFTARVVQSMISFLSILYDLFTYYSESISYVNKVLNVASGKVDPRNKAIFVTGKSRNNHDLLFIFITSTIKLQDQNQDLDLN